MLIKWCRRATHRVGRLLRQLARDDRGQDLIEYALLTGIIAIAGILLFPTIQSRWPARIRTGTTTRRPSRKPRRPCRASAAARDGAERRIGALSAVGDGSVWRRVNDGCSGDLPRPGGGGVRVGSPDPAHSASPDAWWRARRLRVPCHQRRLGRGCRERHRDGRSASRSSSCRLPWAASARETSSCWARLAPGWVR